MLKEDHSIPFDIVQRDAEMMMEPYSGLNSLSRNSTPRKRRISSVKKLYYNYSDINNRTADSTDSTDTASGGIGVYAFNFEDENNQSSGFALVSGDERVPGVLSSSPEGELTEEITNPGEAVFMSRVPEYIDRQVEEYQNLEEAVLPLALEKIESENGFDAMDNAEGTNDDFSEYVPDGNKRAWGMNYFISVSYGQWEFISKIDPIVKVHWGQDDPYNDLVPLYCPKDSDQAPTGCAATAIAQIMSSHQYPLSYMTGPSYNYHSIDWNGLLSDIWTILISPQLRSQIAHLFLKIGILTGMDYGCGGSKASIDDAKYCFNQMGYETSSVRSYDINSVFTSLSNQRPVYIRGCAIEKKERHGWWIFSWTTTDHDGCHAWVIDGYLQKRRPVSIYLNAYKNGKLSRYAVQSYYQTQTYVDCNMGWDGDKDGWYISGGFDTNKGPINPYLNRSTTGTEGDFQFDLKILPDIRPR